MRTAAAFPPWLALCVFVRLQAVLQQVGEVSGLDATQQQTLPTRTVYPQSNPDICVVLISKTP